MKEYNISVDSLSYKDGYYISSEFERVYKTYDDAINDIYQYYKEIKIMDFESKEEKEAREKSIKRNNTIDKILG